MSAGGPDLERAVEAVLGVGLAASTALLMAGLLLGAEAPLRAGVVLLMFTPVVRVVVVAASLLRARDWLFSALALAVLGVLAAGMRVAARL